jgi:hypothetical protein
MDKEYDYEGHDITIEEMPQGCVIGDIHEDGKAIVVLSTADAEHLIESLWRMIKSMQEPTEHIKANGRTYEKGNDGWIHPID